MRVFAQTRRPETDTKRPEVDTLTKRLKIISVISFIQITKFFIPTMKHCKHLFHGLISFQLVSFHLMSLL